MSKNNKLKSVIRHEFLTIIRQPSFWIALVALPLLAGLILLVSALTSDSKDVNIDTEKKSRSVIVIDSSGLIDSDVAKSYNLTFEAASQQEHLEKSVQDKKIDGLIVYPSDLSSTGSYQLFADDTEANNSQLVRELGSAVLQQSLLSSLQSDKLAALAITGGEGTLQSFQDGKPKREISEYIVPGAFLVLFYIILVFSVGYALTSVSEEKENRSIEMVLSYVKPRTLITGKLLAIILVTLTQIIFIGLMAAIAYGIAKSLGNDLSLPFSVSDLSFVPSEILFGIAFLVFGFMFFVGLMAMIGAIFPSSKEANGFSTLFFLLPALPFWGINAITNNPDGAFSQILTYVPLSSPTTVLLRNAVGNLSVIEGIISLVILLISTVLIVALAAKAFRLGTLEYSSRIKFASLLKK